MAHKWERSSETVCTCEKCGTVRTELTAARWIDGHFKKPSHEYKLAIGEVEYLSPDCDLASAAYAEAVETPWGV